MGVLDDEKAPHIAQHHQNMLVHGIDVEQVVLHLPDDAPEHPQVAPKYRGLVHQTHGMGDALRGLQDTHEHGSVNGIAAKCRIHQRPGVVQSAQGASRKTFDTHGFLVKQKGFQNGFRMALIYLVIHNIERARFVCKTRIQRADRMGGGLLKQPLLHIEAHDLVELRHRFGGPVVVLHQSFTGTAGVTLFAGWGR